MTDTPIYDQIRLELGTRASGEAQPRTQSSIQPVPAQGRRTAGNGVSVWALIDENRTHRARDTPGRRRP